MIVTSALFAAGVAAIVFAILFFLQRKENNESFNPSLSDTFLSFKPKYLGVFLLPIFFALLAFAKFFPDSDFLKDSASRYRNALLHFYKWSPIIFPFLIIAVGLMKRFRSKTGGALFLYMLLGCVLFAVFVHFFGPGVKAPPGMKFAAHSVLWTLRDLMRKS